MKTGARNSQTHDQLLLTDLLSTYQSREKTEIAPSVEQILEHIDTEIANVRADDAAGGWNVWALMGVCIALSALLLPLLEKPNLNTTQTIFWIISFSLFADGPLSWFVTSNGPLARANKIRTRPGTFFRSRRPLYIASLFRCIMLIGLVLATWHQFDLIEPGLIFGFVIAYYFMKSLVNIGLLVVSASSKLWPDIIGGGEGIRIIGGVEVPYIFDAVLRTSMLFVLSLAYARAGGMPLLGSPLPDPLRVGFLIALIGFTILWILDTAYRPPVVQELIEIRRRLVFNENNVQQTIKDMNAVLRGGPMVSDVR